MKFWVWMNPVNLTLEHERETPMLKLPTQLVNTQTVVLLVVILLWISLGITSETFLSQRNVQNIMLQMAIQGVIGVGAVVVILTAGIDLSVGSVVGLVNIVFSILITSGNLPIPIAVLLCLLMACCIGWINGTLVFDLKLPPFIATLGMMTVLRGITLLVSEGSNVFGLPRELSSFAQGRLWGLPYLFCILILVTVFVEILLRRTTFGRYVYALGSNREAARLSGVNTRAVTYGVYILAGLLGGIAGCMETSRLWMGVPTTGTMYELDAIAVAVLGGASLMGAEGNAYGAFIGALLMTTIYNGAVLLAIDANYTKVIVGGILIVTVAVDQFRQRHTGK